MVADTDKMGNQEDEYLSEVTSEEQIEGGEFSQFNDPLSGVGTEDVAAAAPQKPSAMRKVATVIVLVIVGLIVSMYLSHKQKVKEEAESGSTTVTKISTASPAEKQSAASEKASTPADKPVENAKVNTADQPKVVDKNTAAPPAANNASLAAAISKSVSAAPAKTESKASTDKANSVPAATENVPETTEKKADISPALSVTPTEAIKAAEPAKSTETAAKTSELAATVSKAPEVPAKVSEVVSPSTSTDTPKIIGRMDDLSLQTQANQTKISDLSTRLDNVDKSLGELNKSIGSLEKKMNVPVAASEPVVTKVVKEPVLTKAPVVAAEPEKIVSNKKMKVALRHGHHGRHGIKPQPPRVQNQQALKWNEKSNVVVTYVLRAVIPGRAWIERPLGGVLTIMEGEYVPGLGKVTRIDADNGEVTLDTGDVIKYGTDDH